MTQIPERFFISEDGQWNADPIEPCMIEAVLGKQYHAEVSQLKTDYNDLYAKGMRQDERDQANLAAAEQDRDEQLRLNQVGQERELRLIAERKATEQKYAALVEALGALPRYTVQTLGGETDEYLDVGGEYVKHDELSATLAQQDQPAGECTQPPTVELVKAIIEDLNQWWKFDGQEHAHSWHEKQDFFGELMNAAMGWPSLLQHTAARIEAR